MYTAVADFHSQALSLTWRKGGKLSLHGNSGSIGENPDSKEAKAEESTPIPLNVIVP